MGIAIGFLVGVGLTGPVAFAIGRFERKDRRVVHLDGPFQTLRSIKGGRR